MNKLIASFIGLLAFAGVAFANLESATVTAIFAPASYTGNTTNSSTNFSAGFKYSGTNTTPINYAIPATGNALFVFRSANASSTNVQTVRIQDSADNTNYTTRATLTISSTAPVKYSTNLNNMSTFWRCQLVTTNAATTGNTSGELIWLNRIQ